MKRCVEVCGVGVVTDGVASVRALIGESAQEKWREAAGRVEELGTEAVAGQDALVQLAIRATHQAWTMAGLGAGGEVSGERVGLVVQSAWGMIDSTVGYLESMLEAEGRYASPRHFSRSVYSSAAAMVAIHFGIHGPCETLSFPTEPVVGLLCQGWRLLATKRCDRVVAVWAEQASAVAEDLAKRAAEGLRRREYERYLTEGLGYGAVAMVLGREGGVEEVDLDELREPAAGTRGVLGRPYAMDAAGQFVKDLMGSSGRGT